MEEVVQWDWSSTLFLNDWGNDYVDGFFNFITHKLSAIPLYLFLLYVLYKKLPTRDFIICLICIALLITASDQLANAFKDGVERYRPFRQPGFMDQVSKVGRSAGTYGFYSGHASNAVALAVFLWQLLSRDRKGIAVIVLVWAALVAYSRVYLGVHYLGDVLMGTFMGSLVAIFIYQVFYFLTLKYGSKTTAEKQA
ncbi:MAG: phosphatase PAP2 family protein [Nonlabens sp.]